MRCSTRASRSARSGAARTPPLSATPSMRPSAATTNRPSARHPPARRSTRASGSERSGAGEEEIAIYDALDARFGGDSDPAVRTAVARALVNKGFRLSRARAR